MSDLIYLDNNATTRPLDEVASAMRACLADGYANPSSVHRLGQRARHAVETARSQVAHLIGAAPGEIVFTSGGTESINLALAGTLARVPIARPVAIGAADHQAVLAVARHAARQGRPVATFPVDESGRISEAAFAQILDGAPGLAQGLNLGVAQGPPALVSLTAANNETGVICDIATLARLAHARGACVHVDAVQAVGRVAIDVRAWGADLVSLSAHKFHGPKGVGALYVRDRSSLAPLMLGGPQEGLRRGGTENTPGIVGMGVAARLAATDGAAAVERVAALRDRLERELCHRLPGVAVVACEVPRLCNTSCLIFEGVSAEKLLLALSEAGVCASSGSACSSGSLEPSHVLKAMGFDEPQARSAVRFSLSRFTTPGEIDRAMDLLAALIQRLG